MESPDCRWKKGPNPSVPLGQQTSPDAYARIGRQGCHNQEVPPLRLWQGILLDLHLGDSASSDGKGWGAVWVLQLGGFQISFLIFLTQSNPARYVIQKGFKDYCEGRLLVYICVHNESLSIKKVICKGPRNGPPRPPPGKRVMTQVAPYLFHAGPQPPKFVSTRSHNR